MKKHWHIWVVEDEVDALMLLSQEILPEGLAGLGYRVNVHAAINGEEALQLLERAPCDLLLTDIRMPGIDGIELFRRVQRESPQTRCILMTGQAPDRAAIEALRIGVSDYVKKPLDEETLLRAIARIIDLMELESELERNRSLLESVISSFDAALYLYDGAHWEVLHEPPSLDAWEVSRETFFREHKIDEIYRRALKEGRPQEKICEQHGVPSRLWHVKGIPLADRQSFSNLVIILRDISNLVEETQMKAFRIMSRQVAHEIKNPLTPMRLMIEELMVRRNSDSQSLPSFVDAMAENFLSLIDRLNRLVSEFSRFGRFPALAFLNTSLNEFVQDEILAFVGSGWDNRIVLDTNFAEGLPPVLLDKEHFGRVLVNLIKNSVEALAEQPEGKITITTSIGEDRQSVRLSIADNGPGIPKEMTGVLFAPYTTTKEKGSGLGLVIVKDLIRQHKGIIKFRQLQPSGCEFIIELPAGETHESD